MTFFRFLALISIFSLIGCAVETGYYYRNVRGQYAFEDANNQCNYEDNLQSRADARAGVDNSFADLTTQLILKRDTDTHILCMKRLGFAYLQHDRDFVLVGEANRAATAGNYELAFQKFLEAAKLGNPYAQASVADMYFEGQGTKKSIIDAIAWYEKSASQNFAAASFNLGLIYEQGKLGIPIDHAKAFHYYSQAAKLKHDSAQYNLALIYRYGNPSVRVDLEKSEELLNAAADAGNEKAIIELANSLILGNYGISVDYKRARMLYNLAAKNKNSTGLIGLSVLYYSGLGVELDMAKSYSFYLLAMENGFNDTDEFGKKINFKMHKNDFEKANFLFELCVKKNYINCDSL